MGKNGGPQGLHHARSLAGAIQEKCGLHLKVEAEPTGADSWRLSANCRPLAEH